MEDTGELSFCISFCKRCVAHSEKNMTIQSFHTVFSDERSSQSIVHFTLSSSVLVKMIDTPTHVLHSQKTASDILEEGGDDVKSAWPLWAGLHTCYNGNYNWKQCCKAERIQKDCLSSDCSLQLENMKLESLVIADQHAAVNKYSGPVQTARQTMSNGIYIRFERYFNTSNLRNLTSFTG